MSAKNDLVESGRAADSEMSSNEREGVVEFCETVPWIEIELVGEDGEPVPYERYELELGDGTVVKGLLDANGRVRLEGIPEEDCTLRLPDLDADAWEPVDGGS